MPPSGRSSSPPRTSSRRPPTVCDNPDFLLTYQKKDDEFVSSVTGRQVSYFCGKCHADIKEKHLGSPHGANGDPTCLYCHAQHEGKLTHLIAHPTPDIIDTRSRAEGGRCSPCHRAATMVKTVARIKKILIDTEKGLATSVQQYHQLEKWGYRNLELEKLNLHAKETQSKLLPRYSTASTCARSTTSPERFNRWLITQATYDLVARLRQVQQQQTLVGIGAVVLLLVFAGLLVYYKWEAPGAPRVGRFLERDEIERWASSKTVRSKKPGLNRSKYRLIVCSVAT